MIRFLIALVCWFILQTAMAQRPVWSKMSPLVREACLSAGSHTGVAKAKGQVMPVMPHIFAFVKTTGDDMRVLNDRGCKVLTRYGRLAIADIPIGSLAALSRDERICRIEARRHTAARMDTTATLLGVPAVHAGVDLPQGYSGRGVVVGVQDIGFDLTHPNFYTADMQHYRIGALWDQLSTDTLGSLLPIGRDYTGSDELLRLAHSRDGLIQTHGTHTAGIAAGSGAEGEGRQSPYQGIAPESDLSLVCNVTGEDISLIDTANYYKYTFALDALGFKYIFDYADRQGKPCVINFSEGSQEDFQGYDQLYYEMLDSLSGPGHIIVAAAGNDAQKITYVEKPAGVGRAGVFCSSRRNAYVSTRADGDFVMRTSFYSSSSRRDRAYTLRDVLHSPDSILRDTFLIDSIAILLTAVAYPSSYNASHTICDWNIMPVGGVLGETLSLALSMEGQETRVEMFPVIGNFYHSPVDTTLCAGDNTHCINSPSSAPSVISVGATAYRSSFVNYLGEQKMYDFGTDGRRAAFSAVGPTWDGRVKPDVMAPGQNIISSYSSYYLEHQPDARDLSSDVCRFTYRNRIYAWNANGGTSMASPVVAGIIALWLEANPRLTPADCRRIFSQTCRRYDSSLTYPNNLYGYGEINAREGIRCALALAATHVTAPMSPVGRRGFIYSIDGRCLGNEASRLAPGIYIQDGKKFIRK